MLCGGADLLDLGSEARRQQLYIISIHVILQAQVADCGVKCTQQMNEARKQILEATHT